MTPSRACPICATVTTQPTCLDCKRRGITALTLTITQLRNRLSRYRADAVGIKRAIAALEEHEHLAA